MTEQQQVETTDAADELPPIKIGQKLAHWSEAKDDRRNKSYCRKVRFGVTVQFRDWQAYQNAIRRVGSSESRLGFVHDALRVVMGACPWPVPIKPCDHAGGVRPLYDSEKAAGTGYEYTMTLVYGGVFVADKPSLIPSEEYCINALGGADNLVRLLTDTIEHGLAQADNEREAHERARIASLMLNEYTTRVEQRALKNTRWEQRYMALVAEYKAELEIQTAEVLAELGDEHGITWNDAPGYVPDARSTAAAKAELPKVIAKKGSPAERGGFFLTHDDKMAIDVDSVR